MSDQLVHAITDKDGKIVYNAISTSQSFGEHDAWVSFFKTNVHQLPLGDAIEAYEAIGYKCVKFKLVEVE